MNDKLNLLHEMAQWLQPDTLAAIIAELNSGEDDLTHNMAMAVDAFTMQLESLVGDESDRMINEVAIDLNY